MHHRERSKKLNSPLGTKLTNFLGNALVDAGDLPSKSTLRAQIAEEFGDVEGISTEKLAEVFVDFAKRGQDRSKRFDLRGHIAEMVVNVVTKLEEADRLMPVPEEPTAEELAAAVEKASDPYADRVGGELARKNDAEIEAARTLVRKAGEAKTA
jgi:hypothetical protein